MTSPKESSMKELQTINTQLKDLEKKIHEINCSPNPCAFMTFAYEGMETGVAILKERREKIYKIYLVIYLLIYLFTYLYLLTHKR